jgi:8-oxo-dGTP pyrophosphatase MutT (NUDIX family)
MNDNLLTSDVNPEARPAATLVLFRASAHGQDQLLVVERSAVMAFAGGAIVFPGGRVDLDDHMIASHPERFVHPLELDGAEAAARVAAIRETLEESGFAVGFETTPDADWIADARVRLADRELFSAMLGDHRLDLMRWCHLRAGVPNIERHACSIRGSIWQKPPTMLAIRSSMPLRMCKASGHRPPIC